MHPCTHAPMHPQNETPEGNDFCPLSGNPILGVHGVHGVHSGVWHRVRDSPIPLPIRIDVPVYLFQMVDVLEKI